MTWKNTLKKFTSRKFLVALFGLISGVVLIINGDVTEGTSSIIASVAAYLVAEGYIDAKSIKEKTEIVLDEINEKE